MTKDTIKSKRNSGVTLLEVMAATAIMTIVMGALFGLSLSMSDTAKVQDVQITSSSDGRRALLELVPELRQAGRMSINWTDLPGESITYQVAEDADGNGVAVNAGAALELSALRTIQRDVDDLNLDGKTLGQLIMIDSAKAEGENITVLANYLVPISETTDSLGVFGPAQDTNGNGRLDQGIWFEPFGSGLLLTVQTQGETRRGHMLISEASAFVNPRN